MSHRLRIFVSSPSDVAAERLRADLIIDKLGQEYSRFVSIGSYRWEHEAMLASKHFQDAIEPPSAFDVVILILWSRLGTPLPERTVEREYRGLDGRAPVTGTEWEYEEALKAARENGAPDLLAFRNISAVPVETHDPDARARSYAQLEALDEFWRRHFVNRGVILAAYDEYRALEEFAERLERSLRMLIERRIKENATGALRSEPVWLGDPFRGLQSYEFEHAPVYFGRDAAVVKATEQLAANARAGCPFLLVSGPSGSGKSSLAMAGIVPRLMKPQRIERAAFVRRVVYRPGGEGTDIILGLARALTRSSGADVGLPELIAPGQDIAQLATHLRGAARTPSYTFGNALGRVTNAGRRSGRILGFEEAKLILVVDQFEELFSAPGFSSDERRIFVEILSGLARSGLVWVIATLRADFWHRAAEFPEIIRMAEGLGRFDLASASSAELAEIIRKPAQAAGLHFELHAQTALGLDVVLAEDAAAAPGALPLLSFTLDELYKNAEARDEITLTHSSYEALGGLEGAIANRADEVLAGLPSAAQASLPRVLRMLATVTGAADQAPVGRSAQLESLFEPGSSARFLVDAFVSARLLIATTEKDGSARVRLAHEALIGRWHRARDQLMSDRRDLQTRELIESQERRWRDARGRAKRQLLLRDPDLASAIDLAARWGRDIDAETRAFIRSSQRVALWRQRLAMVAVAVFFLVAVVAVVAAVQSVRQGEAANVERDRALATQSRLLAARASRSLSDGDTQTAILLSLEALRPPNDVGPLHYEVEAEKTLLDALYHNPLRSILPAAGSKYSAAAFAYDSSILATLSTDGSLSFWTLDGATGTMNSKRVSFAFGPLKAVVSNPARPIFFFQNTDGTFFAWNFETQQLIPGVSGKCTQSPGAGGGGRDAQFAFNFTGDRLFVFCNDVEIFQLDTGEILRPTGSFDRFAVSPSGGEFVVSSKKVVTVMDGATAGIVTSWQQEDAIEGLAITHDGRTILIQNYEGVQFHDSRSGAVSQAPMKTSQARTFGLYVSKKEFIFATVGDDGSAVWNGRRAARIHDVSGVVGFLPNGLLVTSTNAEISLWEYPTEGHTGMKVPVSRATLYLERGHRFLSTSIDGRMIVTLSEAGDLYTWTADPAMLSRAVEDDGQKLGVPIAVSQDGKIIATSSSSGLTIWDGRTLAEVNHLALKQQTDKLVLSPDGRLLVYIDAKGNYDILDTATLHSVKLTTLPEKVSTAGFSVDNSKLALGFENRISIWRTADGYSLRQCDSKDVIGNVIWSERGTLAYASQQGTVGILEPERCNFRQIFSFVIRPFNSSPAVAAISAKEGLFVASLHNQIQVWSESESKQTLSATNADWPIFHPSDAATTLFEALPGERVIVGKDSDRFLHIYDLRTKNEILAFRADMNDCCGPVQMVTLPNGTGLTTLWSERGSFRLRTWRLLPTIEIAAEYAKRSVFECLSPATRKKLGLQQDPPTWCIELGKRPYGGRIWKRWLKDRELGVASQSPASLIEERAKLQQSASERDRVYDWAGSRAAYDKILALDRRFAAADPDELEVREELAVTLSHLCEDYAFLGQAKTALGYCDESLGLRAGDQDTLDSRGLVNLKLGDLGRAIADYDAALLIKPRAPTSLYGRGLAKLQAGDAQGGEADIVAAKKIYPGIVELFAHFGVQQTR